MTLGEQSTLALTGSRKCLSQVGYVYEKDGRNIVVNAGLPWALKSTVNSANWEAAFEPLEKLLKRDAYERDYRLLEDQDAIEAYLGRLLSEPDRPRAFDYETTGLQPWGKGARIHSVACSERSGEGVCFNPNSAPKLWGQCLRECQWVAHNAGFEAIWSLVYFDALPRFLWDTKQAESCLDENRPNGLKYLAVRYTGIGAYVTPEETDWANETIESLWEYNCADADATLQVYETQKARSKGTIEDRLARRLRHIASFARSQHRGVKFDEKRLPLVTEQVIAERDRNYELVKNHAKVFDVWGAEGPNLNSPDVRGKVAYDILGIPVDESLRTPTGQASTKGKYLQTFVGQYPLIGDVLKWVELETIRKNFLVPLADVVYDGRIHPWWNVGGAKTSRISASRPSAQNPPKIPEVRQLILADGTFLAADYSQIELRILASLSVEPALLDAFERGEDIHQATAARIFGVPFEKVTKEQRQRGKNVNFGIVYGITAHGMFKQFQIPVHEAKRLLELYWETMPKVKDFVVAQHEMARTKGYVVTPYGDVRHLPDAGLDPKLRGNRKQIARAMRQAGNSPIQGAAAEMTLQAFDAIDDLITGGKIRGHLALTVHDSIVLDSYRRHSRQGQMLVEAMEKKGQEPWMKCPVVVDLEQGTNYYELRGIADADESGQED